MKCIMSLFYDKIMTTEMYKLSKGLIVYSNSQNFKKTRKLYDSYNQEKIKLH